MKTKKILSMLVAMTMLLICFGITAIAEESATVVAKIGEHGYESVQAAINAAKVGDTVTIKEGTYSVPTMKAGITVVGEGNVLLEGTLSGTLENLTMKNLHIKGGNAQRWAYAKGSCVFENVTFEATSVYALHFDGITEGTTLLYKDCTIIGWAAMGGSPASCVFDNCTIKGNGTYGVIRTYFPTTIKNCKFDVANVNTTDVYQDGIHAVDAKINVNNCENLNGDMNDVLNISGDACIYVDDELVLAPVAKVGGDYYTTLEKALKSLTSGATLTLLADITVDYDWDARFAGAKIAVPVTIDGNGHKLTFKEKVYDGGNQVAVFRFENDATVKNLTFDMTGAKSGWGTRFRAISAKGDLTVDNCTFIGNGSENNTRAIIFGEGSGTAISEVEVSVTNSTFINWQRGVSDNENGQDAKSVVLTGNRFTNAAVYISATDVITFTGNTVESNYVNIKSYTDSENLVVTATGNTLTSNGEGNNMNKIDVASKNVTAQPEFYIPVVLPNATVSKCDPLTLTAVEHKYMVWPSGDATIDRPLEIVMNFKANDTLEECLASGFSDWLVDFNLKFTGLANGSITADNCYLAGNYGAFGWIVIPTDGMVLKEGGTYPVVSAYDATLNYKDICKSVKDFTAAIHVDQSILDANPNFKVELTLVMTNPNDASEKLTIGEPVVYTAADLKNEEEETLNTKTSYVRNIVTKNANNEDRYQVILFAGIDSLDYDSVGFEIIVQGETREQSTKTVYESYTAAGVTYKPTAWGENCKYIFALPINFKPGLKGESVTFRPFALTFEGKQIWGPEKTIDKIYNK